MGRGTDKMFMTPSEWTNHFGGKSGKISFNTEEYRGLPFNCCSLSLLPFTSPVCTKDGIIFDLVNILPYIRKYGTNPVTGEPLKVEDLIKLNIHKNGDGDYCDPVSFNVFTDHSHIVANKNTHNVYAYSTIDKLNLKAKHMFDLITDEPFTKDDLIVLQDPQKLTKRNLNTFHHLKHSLKVDETSKDKVNMEGTSQRIMNELNQMTKKEQETSVSKKESTPSFVKPKAVPYNAAAFSKGKMAGKNLKMV
jgi:peptidyl-prolyl cis-trans isomerase-like protein 2